MTPIIECTHSRFFKLQHNASVYCQSQFNRFCEITKTTDGFMVKVYRYKGMPHAH